jgi:gamma-glutamylputrescine oxidase
MLSFWEKEIWFKEVDFLIVGGGLVGLTAAIFYKRKYPDAKVLLLEKGPIPSGASTKNAGFACFGSPGELIDDLNNQSIEEVCLLVERRFRGFDKLKSLVGEAALGFEKTGGYELFFEHEKDAYLQCLEKLPEFNKLLKPVFGGDAFVDASHQAAAFGFKGFPYMIALPYEGMIHTGKMIHSLIQIAQREGVLMVSGLPLLAYEDLGGKVQFETAFGRFFCEQLLICTNGFSRGIIPELDVEPARAQVLITNPLKDLPLKGVFHFQQGYYYFRNVNDRVLFGGGRNMDKDNERTLQMETTSTIQNHLNRLLKKHILPSQKFEIEDSWAGIMGMGGNNEKQAIVRKISGNVACAVRLGGMGIALGAGIADDAVSLF